MEAFYLGYAVALCFVGRNEFVESQCVHYESQKRAVKNLQKD